MYDKTILEAIMRKEDETDDSQIMKGTWNDFKHEVASGKKIVVYGAGQAAETFIKQFLCEDDIFCFVDAGKAGIEFRNKPVYGPDFFDSPDCKQYVALITSTVYMNEIAHILSKVDGLSYYAVVVMEAKRIKYRVAKSLINFYYYHLLPIKKNKVLFYNAQFGYGDSAKYVARYMHENYPELELFWLTNDPKDEYPEYIKCVENNKRNAIKQIATSKVFIYSDVQGYWLRKRKRQFFVHTWHADLPIKKVGIDSNPDSIKNYQDVKNTAEVTDVFLTNGTLGQDIHRKAFLYSGDFLSTSLPRLDIVINGDLQAEQKVRELYGISPDDFVVMFAPTFRESGANKNRCVGEFGEGFDFEKLKVAIEEKYHKNVVILLRLHPFLVSYAKEFESCSAIIDTTCHRDVYELLTCVDMLITDYSSLMMDAALGGKSVLLYATDIDNYIEKERGFYFDYRLLPFPIAENFEELIDNIAVYDMNQYKNELETFNRDFLGREPEKGDNTQKLCEYIIEHIR